MLKKLRFKFICVNMVIIFSLLCVIFGLFYHFTRENLEDDSIALLQSIAAESFQIGRPGDPKEEVLLPYFTVRIGQWGDIVVTSDYYDLSDETLLRQILASALSSDSQIGVLKEYSLRYYKMETPISQLLVFADTSSEEATLQNLVSTSVLIGIGSMILFFFISLGLANWAVKPVERAWDQQKQFVADASHELKTPLTVILTNAELLQSPDYTDADRSRFSDSILSMARQMRALVESLLEMARVDNGAVKMTFAELDYSLLLSDAILPFEPLYFEKGLPLYYHLEEGIHLKGSESHLRQVLEILLDNAMKYAYPGAPVYVTLKRQGNHCLLSVANAGPAISPEDLKNIFKRFYRADKARSLTGSFGLGLSIAEGIVNAHRGRIWAESKQEVNTFFVQLPTV